MAPEVLDERYTPKVDIYSFGMCVIEMCADAKPYQECANPGEVYRKISSGVKPEGYNRILNEEVKSFIGTCLLAEGQRPTAVELLEHPFLQIDDDDPAVHKPVELMAPGLTQIRPHPPPIEPVRLIDNIDVKTAKEVISPPLMDTRHIRH